MRSHAILSPSAAHRWLNCTASARLEAEYENTTSDFAQEGTFAHSLAELETRYALKMITKAEYTDQLNALKKDSFYSKEMQEYCEEYAAYIKEKFLYLKKTCPDAFVELEVRLDLSDYIPEGFGTADCIIIAEPEMWVVDFKYGKGVKVEAEGNLQMEIYALGALAEYGVLYDIETVGMTIVQPRLGGISEFKMLRQALKAWAFVKIIPGAKEAYEGPGKFQPSEEACKFCKAKADCRARAKYFADLFDSSPDPDLITPEEAGKLLEKAMGMADWIKDIEAKVTANLMQGNSIPGWKLVAGKSNRKFADEEKVVQILKTKARLKKSDIFTTKLNGITVIEKKLGKKKFNELLGELIIKPEGKPTLAQASDNRPEIFPADEIVKAFDE